MTNQKSHHNVPPNQLATNDKHMTTFALTDLVKPSFNLWLLAWILGLMTVFSVIILFLISGWFLSAAAVAGMTALGSHAFNYLLPAAIIRMLAIIRTAGRYGELMLSHHAVFHLLKVLRVKFFHELSGKPLPQQRTALQSGQHMHRLVSDIDILDEFNLRFITPWLMATVSVVTMAIFLWWVLSKIGGGLQWGLIGLLLMVLIIPAVLTKLGLTHAKFLAQDNENRRLALVNPLSVITSLLLWRQWQSQTQAFIALDNKVQKRHWQAQKYRSIAMLLMQWCMMSVLVLVLLMVGFAGHAGMVHANIPLMVGLILGLFGLVEVLLPIAQHYLAYGNAIAAKQRLNELLSHQQDLSNVTTNFHQSIQTTTLMPLPDAPFTAQLNHVTAKLPQALVGATDIHTKIRTGQPLIISGVSGAGKSTLLACLAGELMPQTGTITLNGLDWYAYDWSDQLGYLGQRLDIFDQSLSNNLRLGNPDASDEELFTALHKVALADWAKAQPQGLDTQLGEYGTQVSGGQARRIALARLLLKPRKVLLLDEPFAGLDDNTRHHVWQHLKAHQANGLLVIVSHHQGDWQMDTADKLIVTTVNS